MITAQNVIVELGRTRILDRVDFAALPGEVGVIVGPNGSGKTTLLKALSGDMPYDGTVALNGRDLASLRPAEAARMRAVLPQASVLSFPFTVREVVALGLSGGDPGVHHSAFDTLPERALAEVDLDGFAGRFYQDLSGGEQQRVQLARVLCQVWEPVVDDTGALPVSRRTRVEPRHPPPANGAHHLPGASPRPVAASSPSCTTST